MNNMKKFKALMLFAFTFVTGLGMAQSNNLQDEKAFPKAENGMIKHVIYLPTTVDNGDSDKKVEVYVGTYMETDMCNNYGLLGEFVEGTVTNKNWLNFYTYNTKGEAFSTLKGCLDGGKKTQFVKGQRLLLDYNGRLPIVVYTPVGFEVRYRIFNADTQEYKATTVQQKKEKSQFKIKEKNNEIKNVKEVKVNIDK